MKRLSHPLGEIQVTHKRIRHLYLRLGETPDTLRVSAPLRFGDAEIHAFVSARSEWVRRQREKMARRPTGFDSGTLADQFHLFGRSYRLETAHDPVLRPGKAMVHSVDERLVITTRRNDPSTAWLALREHCRALLDQTLCDRVPHWAERMMLPVPVHRIRRMRTRWGSCNIRDRRIWLNLELVRMPPEVIDLVVVHELAHLFERGHNRRFYAVMDHAYPDWRRWEPALSEYGIIGL